RRSRHLDRLAAARARRHRAVCTCDARPCQRRLPAGTRRRHPARHHRRGAPRQLDRSLGAPCLARRRLLAHLLARLHHVGTLLRRAPDRSRPRPARSHRLPAALDDRALPRRYRTRGRLGGLPRRLGAPHPAFARARGGDARPPHAHDAREHAREHAAGLCPHGAREGPERVARRARPRAAQRAHPGRDLGRARLREPLDRCRDDGDGLLLARPRPLHLHQCRRPRLPGHHGHYAYRRGYLPRHQSPDRHQLRAHGPAGGAMTATAARPALAAASAPLPASRRRRWLRRYGLASLGAAIILAWILVALFAPLISPYLPDTVEVTKRLQPPEAAHWLGTDALGRDDLTRLLYGARISLSTGFIVVVVGAVFGTL